MKKKMVSLVKLLKSDRNTKTEFLRVNNVISIVQSKKQPVQPNKRDG